MDARLLFGAGVLVTVVETGSFTRAADALGLSDSGVSRAVARTFFMITVLMRAARWCSAAN